METTKKHSRVKKAVESKNISGRYRSMDELSATKMESAKDFVANIDPTLFRANGPVE